MVQQFLNAAGNTTDFYHVPDDYDETTNYGTDPMDKFILDEDIIRILQTVLGKKSVASTFFKKFKNIANVFFSQPYPAIAQEMLGFPFE